MLEVKENKVLKLVNVIKRELSAVPQQEVDRATYMMETYLKTRKLNSVGPLITVTHGADVTEDGQLGLDMDIMIQVKEKTITGEPYEFLDTVRIPKLCICKISREYSRIKLWIF